MNQPGYLRPDTAPLGPHVASRGRAAASALAYAPAAPTVVLVMMMIIAVRLHEFVPGSRFLQPALLATFGGLGFLLLNSSSPARAIAFSDRLSRLGMAYLGWAVVTIPFALWSGLAFATIRGLLPAVALMVAFMLCAPTLRTYRKLHTGTVILATTYAAYALLMGRMFAPDRLTAGMGMYDSNDMAALLAMSFPLAVAAFRFSKGHMRTAMAACAVLLVVVVVASGSRGGALGLAAGVAVMIVGLKGSNRVVALLILAFATALIWQAAPTFRERMISLTSLEDDYNTLDEVGRKQVWERGRGYYYAHPITGVGAGNFPIAEGDYFVALYAGTRGAKWSTAHNAYIQAFAELGTIGGLAFVLLLVAGARRAATLWRPDPRSGRPPQPELLAALCTFAVAAIFLSHAYFAPAFGLLGLIALAERTAGVHGASRPRTPPRRLRYAPRA